MSKLSEIPTEEFPLNFVNFCRLQSELQNAADGFADLCTEDGWRVSRDLTQVKMRLDQTWELIRAIERREQVD